MINTMIVYSLTRLMMKIGQSQGNNRLVILFLLYWLFATYDCLVRKHLKSGSLLAIFESFQIGGYLEWAVKGLKKILVKIGWCFFAISHSLSGVTFCHSLFFQSKNSLWFSSFISRLVFASEILVWVCQISERWNVAGLRGVVGFDSEMLISILY